MRYRNVNGTIRTCIFAFSISATSVMEINQLKKKNPADNPFHCFSETLYAEFWQKLIFFHRVVNPCQG